MAVYEYSNIMHIYSKFMYAANAYMHKI